MADTTVAGLPVKISDNLQTPLGAVFVVKGLDDQGKVAYYIAATEGLPGTEAVGMLIVASDEFRAGLAELAREPG